MYKLLKPVTSRTNIKKIKAFKFFRKILGLLFIPKISLVQGFMMKLHKKGHSLELAFDGCYEPAEIEFIYTLNLKNKTVIDIGACIGYYTLHLSRAVGNNGKVLSFEPEQENYKLLCENIALNNVVNASIFKMAVGNKNKVTLLNKHISPGQHSIAMQNISKKQVENILMISLDNFLEKQKINFKNISYVKIDTEGYEFEVLKGMMGVIALSDDIIIQMEFAPQHLECYDFDLKDFLSFVDSVGFIIYCWNFKLNKFLQISETNWFNNDGIIEKFKMGVVYSRNIVLTKKILNKNCYVKEILPMEINETKNNYQKEFYQTSNLMDLKIAINAKLEPPRSGTYFVQALKNVNFKNKKVLDVGTGYFGYLAQHAKYFGASMVVGVDLNESAVSYAKKNHKKDGVSYVVSDIYSSLSKEEKFDILISNPPQLPTIFDGKIHDTAGRDGLYVIRRIIAGFDDYIKKDGVLYLLAFDFLLEAIQDLCLKHDLQCNIFAYYNKTIRQGGETEKRKDYIKKIYPSYSFMKNKNNLIHYVFILEIKKI